MISRYKLFVFAIVLIALPISALPQVSQGIAAPANATAPVAAPTGTAPAAAPAPARVPRVFLLSASTGTNRNAFRDQSAEMAKDFDRDCPSVKITINQARADYTVKLNHIEFGLFIRDNQLEVYDADGDRMRGKEGHSISNGLKGICALITADWDMKTADTVGGQ